MVRYFASQSVNVAILDISPQGPDLEGLEKEFPSAKFIFKKCDILDWQEQSRAFKEVHEKFGRIDIVCSNAGITEIGDFMARDEGEPTQPSMRTVDINLIGNLYSKLLNFH